MSDPGRGPGPAEPAQPDSRPRPAYGEYATAEEQRARIAQPDVTAHFEAGTAPTASVPTKAAAAARARQSAATPAGAATATGAQPHPVDRTITFALLGFGAVNVIFSATSYFDLASIANRAMGMLGVDGEFTNDAAANLWGPIAAVVLVVGFLVTAILAFRRVRARKIAWWIPVTGAVLTYVVVYICLVIPLWGDPAFMDFVTSMS